MKIQSILCLLAVGLLCCDAARMIRTTGEVIPNQFIVGFRGNLLKNQRLGHINQVRQMIFRYEGFNINHVYELPDWSGYSITASTSVINYILSSPLVDYVEEDQLIRTQVCQQQAAPPSWGLDRIDARALPLNQQYNYNADTQGTGVTAYVIDTGIDITHPDFEGRAEWGYTAIANATNTDCNGHGTHVAGTIGSKTYGVAKKVTLVAVKVLNCDGSGSVSNIVDGISWITRRGNASKSVANMSLGGGTSTSLNNAVSSAITAGFLFSVAAGNDNRDACNQSPAGVGSALTVGATTTNDARASYSNWGRCVDLFAPGSNIVSTWPNNSTRTLSGTSMATPHATGVAALMRSVSTSVTASNVVSQGVSNVVNLSCGFLNFGCSLQTTRTMLYTGSCQ